MRLQPQEIAYSTFLGGTAVDNGERIAVDSTGRAVVLGFTSSTDFPVTTGAFDTTPNGGFDLSVTKLNATGAASASEVATARQRLNTANASLDALKVSSEDRYSPAEVARAQSGLADAEANLIAAQ